MQNLRKILKNSFVADVEYHVSIGSTNDRASECAASDGTKLPFLVLADCQTAGRGRGSNRWWTGQGSLAFSLLIGSEHIGTSKSPLISLAAGVAIVEAIKPLVSGHEIGIHWPNDCVIGGRKLAGTLIERGADGKHILGIGINTNNMAADAPSEVRPRVATLRDVTGYDHDNVDILIAVLRQLELQLAELARWPEGVAARTNELCMQRGKRLHIAQGHRQIDGRCLGIDVDGALLIEIGNKTEAVYSGVVTRVGDL